MNTKSKSTLELLKKRLRFRNYSENTIKNTIVITLLRKRIAPNTVRHNKKTYIQKPTNNPDLIINIHDRNETVTYVQMDSPKRRKRQWFRDNFNIG